jgi:hypothetical protein
VRRLPLLLALLSYPLLFVILSEARRSASDRARVEGPLHLCHPTIASGNSHRATSLCRVSYLLALLSDLFLCHPERSAKKRKRPSASRRTPAPLPSQQSHQGILTTRLPCVAFLYYCPPELPTFTCHPERSAKKRKRPSASRRTPAPLPSQRSHRGILTVPLPCAAFLFLCHQGILTMLHASRYRRHRCSAYARAHVGEDALPQSSGSSTAQSSVHWAFPAPNHPPPSIRLRINNHVARTIGSTLVINRF